MKKTFSILLTLALVLSFSVMAVPSGPALASPGNLYVDDDATADGTVVTCKLVGALGANELYASGTPGPFQSYDVGDSVEFISGTADGWVTTIATKHNNNRVALAGMYSGGDFSDGTFNLVDLDAPSVGDPFRYIQSAITIASSPDTINVAAGTYTEYLHITKDNLTVQGAGIDQSIIDLDGLIPYWHYTGCSKSFASRAGVYITGYGSPDDIIEGVTFSGFTVKNAGLNPPITATGQADAADATGTVLTDTSQSWTPGAFVGEWLHNVSDKLIKIDISGNNPIRSYGQITANTATTITATLAGGQENDWDIGDTYVIMPYEEYVDVAEDLQDDVTGIGIANGKDVTISYCKVINSGSSGIGAGYARCVTLHKYSEGITIDHCTSSGNPKQGISIGKYVGAVTITNNTCYNNGSPHPTDPSRERTGVGILVTGLSVSQPASGVISDNTCTSNGFEGIVLKNYTDGVTIENNTVTGSNLDEDGAGIFFYGKSSNPANCKNHIIRNNTVTGNIRGIVAYYAQACTIEGNTITTDSGAFASGQAAIKIDGGINIMVKDNTISCDGAGIKVQKTWNDKDCYNNNFTGNTITGAKFAGIFISNGAHDNTFTCNTITGTTILTRGAETQGDGVFIDDDAGTGNVFHGNSIYGNADDGMESQILTAVDAENNWWGDADGSGPYDPAGETIGGVTEDTEAPPCSGSRHMMNTDGTGDKVQGRVDYCPWVTASAIPTVTGTGTASFATACGSISGLTAIPEGSLPTAGKPNFVFPHGFFSFNITGLSNGQIVTVVITLPSNVPVGTQYWKYHASEGGWIQIPMGSDDGDNVITITLVDGGLGDDDGFADGTIVDQGGPGFVGISPFYRLDIFSTEGGSVTTPGEKMHLYVKGKVVNLVVSPDDGCEFVEWIGDVDTIADVDDASTTITIGNTIQWEVLKWYCITAKFEAEGTSATETSVQYVLTVSSTMGGSVTSPGEGASAYEAGTVVNLMASPDDGYEFVDWTGDSITNVDSATTSVTMNDDYTVKAAFGEITGTDSGGESSIPVGACFIATAAYGTPTAEQIDVLREFRDVVLLENSVGSEFVALYYQLSPPIADFIGESGFLRTMVREFVVDPVVWVIEATGAIWRN